MFNFCQACSSQLSPLPQATHSMVGNGQMTLMPTYLSYLMCVSCNCSQHSDNCPGHSSICSVPAKSLKG
ncbi:hypothetical protein BD324DRAFT_640321 [Kockovaella imperatae]|uniref:Uncharacterized protein n=1 Tax=Kockovaella imperatae TaxID=4999 RepID=A0A1Y1U5G6_9TREE|nr:hypothetical protein BD324DRAFT_640321 [Kockovaella imperatae]ORX33270.1 hypothetical protein BD324DRAFT_640321 [Kockovaella imperatae]